MRQSILKTEVHKLSIEPVGTAPHEQISLVFECTFTLDPRNPFGSKLFALIWKERPMAENSADRWVHIGQVFIRNPTWTMKEKVRTVAPNVQLTSPLWPGVYRLSLTLGASVNLGGPFHPVSWVTSGLRADSMVQHYILASDIVERQLRKPKRGHQPDERERFSGKVDVLEHDFAWPKHPYRLGNTNLALLDYRPQNLLALGEHEVVYTTVYGASFQGPIPRGLPFVSVAETMRRRGQPYVQPLINELLQAGDTLAVDCLPWSPVIVKALKFLSKVPKKISRAVGKSHEGADFAYAAGSEAVKNTPDNIDFGLEQAVIYSLRALQWNPNNLYALACAAKFEAQREGRGVAIDFVVGLSLRLRLIERILREAQGSPSHVAAQLALASSFRPDVKRFLPEAAALLGLQEILPLNFPEAEKEARAFGAPTT